MDSTKQGKQKRTKPVQTPVQKASKGVKVHDANNIRHTTQPAQGVHGAHGVGRRKAAIARVWLVKGNGKITINEKDYLNYFDTDIARYKASKVHDLIPEIKKYDAQVNIVGGGLMAQADAVQLGLARALLILDENLKSTLREHGFLTVDSRVKERKKYGQKAARRKFQFVKR